MPHPTPLLLVPCAARLAAVGLIALLAGCAEDGGLNVALPAGSTATGAGNRAYATPTPLVIATPYLAPPPDVATPAPTARPVVTPTPTAEPAPVGATPTPSPTPSDAYTKTDSPLDLAISGPAYFVYATRPNPDSVADLVLSRNGHLRLERDGGGTVAYQRLRHADTGFYLVGFSLPGTAETAPDEATTTEGLVLNWAVPPAVLVRAQGLALDAERNGEAAFKLNFDYTGRVRIGEADPRGSDGYAATVYVALAQVETPDKLEPVPGFAGMLRYKPEAGALRLGVAVTGANRTLGNANLIRPRTLEQGD